VSCEASASLSCARLGKDRLGKILAKVQFILAVSQPVHQKLRIGFRVAGLASLIPVTTVESAPPNEAADDERNILAILAWSSSLCAWRGSL